jgi:pimeloyl-ACP methyl ester carboxylesterase
VLWGSHDPFLVEAGAHAYRADLPKAEIHVFDTDHFALEECLPAIVPIVENFLTRITSTFHQPEPVGGSSG